MRGDPLIRQQVVCLDSRCRRRQDARSGKPATTPSSARLRSGTCNGALVTASCSVCGTPPRYQPAIIEPNARPNPSDSCCSVLRNFSARWDTHGKRDDVTRHHGLQAQGRDAKAGGHHRDRGIDDGRVELFHEQLDGDDPGQIPLDGGDFDCEGGDSGRRRHRRRVRRRWHERFVACCRRRFEANRGAEARIFVTARCAIVVTPRARMLDRCARSADCCAH